MMAIRSVGTVEFNRIAPKLAGHPGTPSGSRGAQHTEDTFDDAPVVNLQEELNNAADEMADLLSTFGRFSKTGRRNDNTDNDFVSSILEEKADEKLDTLIRQVAKLRDLNSLLNFARHLFPNDSDLLLALRELLLSRRLSELQKKKIKEAIADLKKFGDHQKIQSGINVGKLAKRFSEGSGGKQLSAKDLRNSYLSFLELSIPAGFIYKEWIDVYGCHNRKRLLTFTLSALVADMKANEPGIHFSEFGPLSAKLSDARVLHTLDQTLNEIFAGFVFREQMRNQQRMLEEENIVSLYMSGLVDTDNLESGLHNFGKDFMSLLTIKHRSRVIQELRNIYNVTPEFLFASTECREIVLDILSSLLHRLHKKEKNTGIWREYYK